MKTKVFREFDSIEIPNGSLVLLCGVQNCGKSTWANKHFPKSNIVSTDDILSDLLKSHSPEKTSFSEIAALHTEIVRKKVLESQRENSYTVIDAVSTNYQERIPFMMQFAKHFSKVIIICFKINLLEIISRGLKVASLDDDKWGLTFPDAEYLAYLNLNFMQEIQKGVVFFGTDFGYVLNTFSVNTVSCKLP